MTYEEMDAQFFNLWDKSYSGYPDWKRRNQFFNKAQLNKVEEKYQQSQANRKIADELSGLVATENITVNGNSTTLEQPNINHPYYHYWAGEVTYTINGETLTIVPYTPTEDMRLVRDPFDSASITQPFLRIFKAYDSNNDVWVNTAFFYPVNTPVDNFTIVYLRKPTEINVLDDQNGPEYNEKMQEYVIEEAVNIAAQAFRDASMFKMTEQQIKQNP